MKKNKDFRISHVKRIARRDEEAVMLGPLRGCPTQEKHFASDCEACKSLYGRYLREREANIEARIAAQRIVNGVIVHGKDIPMTASPFSR